MAEVSRIGFREGALWRKEMYRRYGLKDEYSVKENVVEEVRTLAGEDPDLWRQYAVQASRICPLTFTEAVEAATVQLEAACMIGDWRKVPFECMRKGLEDLVEFLDGRREIHKQEIASTQKVRRDKSMLLTCPGKFSEKSESPIVRERKRLLASSPYKEKPDCLKKDHNPSSSEHTLPDIHKKNGLGGHGAGRHGSRKGDRDTAGGKTKGGSVSNLSRNGTIFSAGLFKDGDYLKQVASTPGMTTLNGVLTRAEEPDDLNVTEKQMARSVAAAQKRIKNQSGYVPQTCEIGESGAREYLESTDNVNATTNRTVSINNVEATKSIDNVKATKSFDESLAPKPTERSLNDLLAQTPSEINDSLNAENLKVQRNSTGENAEGKSTELERISTDQMLNDVVKRVDYSSSRGRAGSDGRAGSKSYSNHSAATSKSNSKTNSKINVNTLPTLLSEEEKAEKEAEEENKDETSDSDGSQHNIFGTEEEKHILLNLPPDADFRKPSLVCSSLENLANKIRSGVEKEQLTAQAQVRPMMVCKGLEDLAQKLKTGTFKPKFAGDDDEGHVNEVGQTAKELVSAGLESIAAKLRDQKKSPSYAGMNARSSFLRVVMDEQNTAGMGTIIKPPVRKNSIRKTSTDSDAADNIPGRPSNHDVHRPSISTTLEALASRLKSGASAVTVAETAGVTLVAAGVADSDDDSGMSDVSDIKEEEKDADERSVNNTKPDPRTAKDVATEAVQRGAELALSDCESRSSVSEVVDNSVRVGEKAKSTAGKNSNQSSMETNNSGGGDAGSNEGGPVVILKEQSSCSSFSNLESKPPTAGSCMGSNLMEGDHNRTLMMEGDHNREAAGTDSDDKSVEMELPNEEDERKKSQKSEQGDDIVVPDNAADAMLTASAGGEEGSDQQEEDDNLLNGYMNRNDSLNAGVRMDDNQNGSENLKMKDFFPDREELEFQKQKSENLLINPCSMEDWRSLSKTLRERRLSQDSLDSAARNAKAEMARDAVLDAEDSQRCDISPSHRQQQLHEPPRRSLSKSSTPWHSRSPSKEPFGTEHSLPVRDSQVVMASAPLLSSAMDMEMLDLFPAIQKLENSSKDTSNSKNPDNGDPLTAGNMNDWRSLSKTVRERRLSADSLEHSGVSRTHSEAHQGQAYQGHAPKRSISKGSTSGHSRRPSRDHVAGNLATDLASGGDGSNRSKGKEHSVGSISLGDFVQSPGTAEREQQRSKGKEHFDHDLISAPEAPGHPTERPPQTRKRLISSASNNQIMHPNQSGDNSKNSTSNNSKNALATLSKHPETMRLSHYDPDYVVRRHDGHKSRMSGGNQSESSSQSDFCIANGKCKEERTFEQRKAEAFRQAEVYRQAEDARMGMDFSDRDEDMDDPNADMALLINVSNEILNPVHDIRNKQDAINTKLDAEIELRKTIGRQKAAQEKAEKKARAKASREAGLPEINSDDGGSAKRGLHSPKYVPGDGLTGKGLATGKAGHNYAKKTAMEKSDSTVSTGDVLIKSFAEEAKDLDRAAELYANGELSKGGKKAHNTKPSEMLWQAELTKVGEYIEKATKNEDKDMIGTFARTHETSTHSIGSSLQKSSIISYFDKTEGEDKGKTVSCFTTSPSPKQMNKAQSPKQMNKTHHGGMNASREMDADDQMNKSHNTIMNKLHSCSTNSLKTPKSKKSKFAATSPGRFNKSVSPFREDSPRNAFARIAPSSRDADELPSATQLITKLSNKVSVLDEKTLIGEKKVYSYQLAAQMFYFLAQNDFSVDGLTRKRYWRQAVFWATKSNDVELLVQIQEHQVCDTSSLLYYDPMQGEVVSPKNRKMHCISDKLQFMDESLIRGTFNFDKLVNRGTQSAGKMHARSQSGGGGKNGNTDGGRHGHGRHDRHSHTHSGHSSHRHVKHGSKSPHVWMHPKTDEVLHLHRPKVVLPHEEMRSFDRKKKLLRLQQDPRHFENSFEKLRAEKAELSWFLKTYEENLYWDSKYFSGYAKKMKKIKEKHDAHAAAVASTAQTASTTTQKPRSTASESPSKSVRGGSKTTDRDIGHTPQSSKTLPKITVTAASIPSFVTDPGHSVVQSPMMSHFSNTGMPLSPIIQGQGQSIASHGSGQRKSIIGVTNSICVIADEFHHANRSKDVGSQNESTAMLAHKMQVKTGQVSKSVQVFKDFQEQAMMNRRVSDENSKQAGPGGRRSSLQDVLGAEEEIPLLKRRGSIEQAFEERDKKLAEKDAALNFRRKSVAPTESPTQSKSLGKDIVSTLQDLKSALDVSKRKTGAIALGIED